MGNSAGGSASLLANSFTVSNPINLGTSAVGTLTVGNNGGATAVVFSGPIGLNGDNLTISATGTGSTTLSGGVTGSGNLTLNVNGSGSILLNTTSPNNTGTITNAGTGTSPTFTSQVIGTPAATAFINSTVGGNVTGIIQNSATSDLLGAVGSTYNHGITIQNGTLLVGDTANGLGANTNVVTLGNSSANATLQYGGALGLASAPNPGNQTFANPIHVGGSGVNVISATDWNPTYSGPITLNSANLTLAPINTSGSTITVTDGVTGTGNITVSVDGNFAANLVSFTTQPVNNNGTITFNNALVNGGVTGSTNTGTNLITGGVGASVTGIFQNSNSNPLTISTTALTTVSSGTTTLTANGTALFTVSGGVGGTGSLVLNNNSTTGNGTTTGGITLMTAAVNNGGTITNSGVGSGSTLISANIGSSVTGVIQNSATSALILSGTNTYTGGTTVSAGTLLASGASPLPSGTTLTVAPGATFSLLDNTARTTNVDGGLSLSGGTLAMDWTASGVDQIATSAAAVTSGNIGIALTANSPIVGGGTLLSATSGLSGGGSTHYFLANNTNYSATLNATDSTVTVGSYLAVTALTNAYWYGGQVATGTMINPTYPMAFSSGTVSNWSSAAAYAPTALVPGSTANVFFSITSGGTPTQESNIVLGGSMTLNSLTFNDTTPVTIAADGSTLTINAAAVNGNTLGNGITVNSGAGIATIYANVALGAAQTWTTAGSTQLNVVGVISGAFGLTTAGSGKVILSGANIYTGTTTVSGGTLQLGSGGSILSGNALTTSGTGTFDLAGVSQTLGTVTNGGTITSSSPTSTLHHRQRLQQRRRLLRHDERLLEPGRNQQQHHRRLVEHRQYHAQHERRRHDHAGHRRHQQHRLHHQLRLRQQQHDDQRHRLPCHHRHPKQHDFVHGSDGRQQFHRRTLRPRRDGCLGSGVGHQQRHDLSGQYQRQRQCHVPNQCEFHSEQLHWHVQAGSTGTLTILGQQSMSGAITLNNNVTIQSYSSSGGSTFSGGITGTGNVTLQNTNGGGGGNTLTISSINSGGTITDVESNNPTNGITVNNIGSNVTGVTMNGTGSGLTLGGVNTFSGGVNINIGTVVANASNVGTTSGAAGPSTNAITLGSSSGGSAAMLANSFTVSNPINLGTSAVGTLTIGNNGGGTAANFSGPIGLNGDNLTISASGTGSTMISGGVTGAGNLTLSNAGSGAITLNTAAINNTGTITNVGAGTTGNITQQNTGTPAATAFINFTVGANVTSILQNSATADMLLGSIGSTYNNGITIQNGVLLINDNANALGKSTNVVTLGNSSTNATLQYGGALGGQSTSPSGNQTFANPINVGGAGTNVISASDWSPTYSGPITLNSANLTVAPVNAFGSDIFLTGGVSGAGNITVSVDGNIASNFVSFTTAAVNNGGTITFNNALVNGAVTGANNTGTNTITGGVGSNVTAITQASNTNPLTISGTAITVNSAGTTLTAGGTALFTVSGGVNGMGNLILNNNSTTASGITLSGSSVNNTGAITNSGNGNGSTLISATIGSSVNGVTQSSATSSLTLSGANSYTGATTVSAGSLFVNNTSGSGTGSSNVGVNDATLGGTGSLTGNVTLTGVAGATLTSSGTLTIGALTVNGTNNQLSAGAISTTGDTVNGSFRVNGTLQGTGTTSVADGGSLLGTGTISKNVTVGTVSGGVTLSSRQHVDHRRNIDRQRRQQCPLHWNRLDDRRHDQRNADRQRHARRNRHDGAHQRRDARRVWHGQQAGHRGGQQHHHGCRFALARLHAVDQRNGKRDSQRFDDQRQRRHDLESRFLAGGLRNSQ